MNNSKCYLNKWSEIKITTLEEFINDADILFVYKHNKSDNEINDIITKATNTVGNKNYNFLYNCVLNYQF
jgi:hypothetical protein